MKIAVEKPAAGSNGSVISVTPSPLLSRSQFDPVRLRLSTPSAPLKFSVIVRRSSASTPTSSVFCRSAVMPATALLGVSTPRSIDSPSTARSPR